MMLEAIAQLAPLSIGVRWQASLRHAGITHDGRRLLGMLMLLMVVGGCIGALIAIRISAPSIVGAILGFIIPCALSLALLSERIERRAQAVDAVLPDALVLMSANLRAGMTIERALLLSGKHKLGVLRSELEHIGKQVVLGMPLDVALARLPANVRSQHLADTVRLIIGGVRAGGEMAMLLDGIARTLRNGELTEKKTRAAIASYSSFIFIAVGFVMPVLLGLSVFFVTLLGDVTRGIELPQQTLGTGMSTGVLRAVCTSILFLGSIFASLLMGQITKGKAVFGLQHTLPLMALMLGVFHIVLWIVPAVIGGVLG